MSSISMKPYEMTVRGTDGTPLLTLKLGEVPLDVQTPEQLRAWLDAEGVRMLAELQAWADAWVVAEHERAAGNVTSH